MIKEYTINLDHWTLDDIASILKENKDLTLGSDARKKVEACRKYLDEKIESSERPIYGVNTGFGSLCDTEISKDQLAQLQINLVRSHACGMGAEVSSHLVRLMLLLKIKGLALGHSGIAITTLERLIDLYNHKVYPVVYELGSLGASGDLAPLAHLSLPLFGEGEVNYQGQKRAAADVLKELALEPIQLTSKEGLALLNGTQFMSAFAVDSLIRIKELSLKADLVAAASIDAFEGCIKPFHPSIQDVRPHNGQVETAINIRSFLEDSELIKKEKAYVQDPYCLRCIPQVHGASKDAIAYAERVVEVEINSVTDNPTVFPDEDEVISAGNFHGQHLALVLDFLAIAIAELGSISERRTYKLVSGQRNLPPFLLKGAGLNSGFMIAQYAAASAVSQNKQLCTPASVDSIDSSNGQEDHVSMGANAATKLKRVIDNYESILGVELFTAMQALDFRDGKSSKQVEKLKMALREEVPFLEADTVMYELIEASRVILTNYEL
jgi:histidine ammonia-lyase